MASCRNHWIQILRMHLKDWQNDRLFNFKSATKIVLKLCSCTARGFLAHPFLRQSKASKASVLSMRHWIPRTQIVHVHMTPVLICCDCLLWIDKIMRVKAHFSISLWHSLLHVESWLLDYIVINIRCMSPHSWDLMYAVINKILNCWESLGGGVCI